MNKEYLFKEVPFITKDDVIEKVNDSFSGALVLKVIKNDKKYFFKLYDNKDGELERIKNICKLYSKTCFVSLSVIDCGITTDNKVWFVFNWVEGVPLNKLYNLGHNFYEYGYSVGETYRKINEDNKNNKLDSKFDLGEALNIKDTFNNLYEKDELLHLNFNEENLTKTNDAFLKLLPIFDSLEKEFIHGDMHPKNVMLDNDNNLVLIDIDSFRYDYFIYNFRWSISSIYKYEDNKLFFRGFIDGRYKNNDPKNINKQLIFILIFKFYEQMTAYYQSGKLDVLKQQIRQYNTLFFSLDLSGKTSILDDNSWQ